MKDPRSIGAALREEFQVYDPETEEFEEVTLHTSDGHSAPDFGDFDATVAAEVTHPPGWNSGRLVASMNSRLAEEGLFTSGHFSGRTGTEPGGYGIQAIVDVTFEIDLARTYRLVYSMEADSSALPRLRMSLSRVGGGVVFEEVPSMHDSTTIGARSGALAPGRYRYLLDYQVGGDVGTSGPYSVDLVLAPSGATAAGA